MLLEINPKRLLKLGSGNVTQNMFQKNYSKLVPQSLLEVERETLPKISFTIVSRNGRTKVTQNWFHKCDLPLVSQTLLKITSTSVTRNRPTIVAQN